MVSHYINRGFKTIRDEGFEIFLSRSIPFLLSSIPRTGIPYYYKIKGYRNWKHSGDFCCRPDPFKIIWIDPKRVKYNSGNRFSYLNGKYLDSGKVVDGDWDIKNSRQGKRTIYPSDEPKNTIHRSFRLHFEYGYDWKNTPLIQRIINKISQGEKEIWHGSSTISDVFERCEKMDELYRDVKRVGYKSQRELIEQNSPNLKNPQYFRRAYDEVVVNISRRGELLFVGGHHRLAIAKILDIDNIPVRIFIRHKQWQECRDRIFNKNYTEEDKKLLSHPDLQDIHDGSGESPEGV